MMTKDEVKKAFLSDLNALLGKYGAEITAENHWNGYAECGSDIKMTVAIDPIYENGDCKREYTSFSIGTYVSHK